MEEKKKRIEEIENLMSEADFWSDKDKAQGMIREMQNLKDEIEGVSKYDRGDAIFTIFSGAGGDDAEDWSKILFEMYVKFANRNNFKVSILDQNQNDQGGFRSISFEIAGKNAYGILKNESGVHRLVRMSPFNAKGLRQTSFSMVEVVPKFEKFSESKIPETDVRVEFAKSSGPGGQNVNKRETAARAVHIPTGLAVSVSSERSQGQNKDKALAMLAGKVFRKEEEERKQKESGMYVSKSTANEWGSQIRSYVFHPYKLIKDHRTDVEVRDIDRVLEGDLSDFLEK